MTEMTIEVRDSLAPQIQSFGIWLSTLIELTMTNFKHLKPIEAKAELIEFLSRNPSSHEVLNYSLSTEYQERLDYLLDLNGEDEIAEREKEELSEWITFNHICILLAAAAAKELKRNL